MAFAVRQTGATDCSVFTLPFSLVALVFGSVFFFDIAGHGKGIPVGTPYLEGFPPGEEFPKVTWIAQLVGALLSIAVGTFR